MAEENNSEQTQKQVWNAIAQLWNKFRKYAPKEIINFLKNKEGKVLDLGCGSGRNFIKQDNLEYYGVDFSSEMLKLAQRDASERKIKVKLKEADLTNLPFEDDFFDASLFISTLHCIEGEDNRKRVLEELYRVLKEDAEAMITVWDKDTTERISQLEAKEGLVNWKSGDKVYKRYYYFYDKDEIIDLLKSVGFKILESSVYQEDKHSKRNIIVYVKK